MLLKDRKRPPAVKRVFRLFVLALVCACVVLSGCERAIAPSEENQVDKSATAETSGGTDTRDAPETSGEGEAPPAQTTGEGETPPAQTPDEGETPPAQTPDEGETPPAQTPDEGEAPPAQTPDEGEAPPAQTAGETESAQALQSIENQLRIVRERLQSMEEQLQTTREQLQTVEGQLQATEEKIQTMEELPRTGTEQPRSSPGIFGILFLALSVLNFLLFLSLGRKISEVEISLKRQQSAFKPLAPTDVSLKQDWDGFSPPPPEGQNSYQAPREKKSTPPQTGYDTRTPSPAGQGSSAGYGTQTPPPAGQTSPAARTKQNESSRAFPKPEVKYFKVSSAKSGTVFLAEDQNGGDLVGTPDAKSPDMYSIFPLMQNVDGKRGTLSASILTTGGIPHCFTIESQGSFHKPGRFVSVEAPARAVRDGNRLRLTQWGKLRVTGHY